jgi:3-oxoacyl-[acyl-carrier-protein] synthase-3
MIASPGAIRSARIAGIEYALPERVVSNAELAALHPGWKMPQVALRTGVSSRHWCRPDQTALDLAVDACARLEARSAGIIARTDTILFCTQSPDHWMPPNACLLQDRLGLPVETAALDFSLACSGYVYGLHLANALLASGGAQQVLLVAAETYSKWMHPGDRGPMTLFGDGAAATVLVPDQSGTPGFALGSDGSGAKTFCIPAGAARTARSPESGRETTDASGNVRTAEHLMMDGAAVLDFVKREMPRIVTAYLARAAVPLESIDLVVFHQASRVGLDYLNAALHVPEAKRFSNLASIGNTVSASIPIALRDAELAGRLTPGMRVLLVGFGVGLSWGVGLIHWNPTIET